MEIKKIKHDFSVCKVKDYSLVDFGGEFVFAGKTDEENSLVCPTGEVPENATEREDGWRAFRVAGALDFSLTGVLAGLSKALAEAGVGIFAVSTYDTDYILVKGDNLPRALAALRAAGHEIEE